MCLSGVAIILLRLYTILHTYLCGMNMFLLIYVHISIFYTIRRYVQQQQTCYLPRNKPEQFIPSKFPYNLYVFTFILDIVRYKSSFLFADFFLYGIVLIMGLQTSVSGGRVFMNGSAVGWLAGVHRSAPPTRSMRIIVVHFNATI